MKALILALNNWRANMLHQIRVKANNSAMIRAKRD